MPGKNERSVRRGAVCEGACLDPWDVGFVTALDLRVFGDWASRGICFRG